MSRKYRAQKLAHENSIYANIIGTDVSTLCPNCCRFNENTHELCPKCQQTTKNVPSRVSGALGAGTLLGPHGRYFLGRTLGRGGFGITYLGYDRMMMRRVAIKEFFPVELVGRANSGQSLKVRAADDSRLLSKERARFVHEAQMMAHLSERPCLLQRVAPIYDIFEALNTTYLVMGYVSGQTLAEIVEQRMPSPVEAVGWCTETLDILHRLHEMNIVHRDIKPANLMLADSQRVVLLDFGAARILSSQPNTVIVTPGFAPPEAFRPGQEELSPAMDIYSLGATLYFLLTANIPPQGYGRENNVWRVVANENRKRISEELQHIVLCALSYEQHQRFISAEHFAAALAQTPEMRSFTSSFEQSGLMEPFSTHGGASLVRQQKPRKLSPSACSSLGSASLRRHVLIFTESIRIPVAVWVVAVSIVSVLIFIAGFAARLTGGGQPRVLVQGSGGPAPNVARADWEEDARNLLVGLFDKDHSHLIDTPQEVEEVECSLYDKLLWMAQERGLAVSLVADYHFGPTGEFRGWALGYGERVRGRVFRKLQDCGLVSEMNSTLRNKLVPSRNRALDSR